MPDIARVPQANDVPSPARFAHCVMKSNDLEAMRAWYTTVLGAETMFANERIVFLTYDDEHHRIAFVKRDGLKPPVTGTVGLDHIAYAYDSLADLVGAYERLKAVGIVPRRTVNHGPTTSMYYADPDGNGVELQVDNFRSVDALNDWFSAGAFNRDQFGADIDMDDIARRLHEGAPEAELLMPRPEPVEA
jgi:catechol-2,3-dioxygenase